MHSFVYIKQPYTRLCDCNWQLRFADETTCTSIALTVPNANANAVRQQQRPTTFATVDPHPTATVSQLEFKQIQFGTNAMRFYRFK